METASVSDKGVGFSLLFGAVGLLGAVGLAVFGFTGDQSASAWSFAAAMLGGSLAIAAYHVYG